jgi:hypothetical protein
MIITPEQGPVSSGVSGSKRPIFQNLGPGTLYFSTSPANIATEGIKMPVNAVYEMPTTLVEGAGAIWFVAVGGTCDIRIINVG